MGNGIIGKILFFWVFIIGGMFIASATGAIDTANWKSVVPFIIALAIIYIVWNVFRAKGKKRREAKEAANAAPIRKGQNPKKKKHR